MSFPCALVVVFDCQGVCVCMRVYVHVYVRTWMHVCIRACSIHACRIHTYLSVLVHIILYYFVHSNQYIQFNAYNSHVQIHACSCDLFLSTLTADDR